MLIVYHDDYNLLLLDKKGKIFDSFQYFKGSNFHRISWQGYGETELVNGCIDESDCTEVEHPLNGRLEFIVVTR